MEQGRTVFALPGRIDTPGARGPHMLIKNGAKLVERIDDILEEYEFLIPPSELETPESAPAARPDVPMTAQESKVMEALWQEPMDWHQSPSSSAPARARAQQRAADPPCVLPLLL